MKPNEKIKLNLSLIAKLQNFCSGAFSFKELKSNETFVDPKDIISIKKRMGSHVLAHEKNNYVFQMQISSADYQYITKNHKEILEKKNHTTKKVMLYYFLLAVPCFLVSFVLTVFIFKNLVPYFFRTSVCNFECSSIYVNNIHPITQTTFHFCFGFLLLFFLTKILMKKKPHVKTFMTAQMTATMIFSFLVPLAFLNPPHFNSVESRIISKHRRIGTLTKDNFKNIKKEINSANRKVAVNEL